ncbi:MAG TPA: adenylosuccinate lyase [Planctomycetes bacterium]|nr:adenylosuccinate lyase [Planctomycetota bacterium]
MSEGQNPAEEYQNPLVTRYAGKRMRALFSPLQRARTWRDLWIALAEAERDCGLDISEEQLQELRNHRDDIDLERIAELERELRHDVMAHVHQFGEVAPLAKGILHLGATSCFITDNADLWIYREGLALLEQDLVTALHLLRDKAREYRDLPCLGATHYQPAQPVTLGKRICLWAQDLALDLQDLRSLRQGLPFRGAKGTTGTQASFLALFGGDHAKVRELDRLVATKMGFDRILPVTGQTYPRKLDHRLLSVLSGIAQSTSKFGVDFRLLSHEGEVSEPFTEKQIGSSAMAYKRNPMRSERICSLARLVLSLAETAGATASVQWLERSLDDSAIRRISIPEAFLGAQACLSLEQNIVQGMRVYPKMCQRHLDEQLPFLATESILMEGVKAGGDRQELHESIRKHAVEAARRMKEEGIPNPLVEALEADPVFSFAKGRIQELLDARLLVGRAPQQVDEFLEEFLEPLLEGTEPSYEDQVRV